MVRLFKPKARSHALHAYPQLRGPRGPALQLRGYVSNAAPHTVVVVTYLESKEENVLAAWLMPGGKLVSTVIGGTLAHDWEELRRRVYGLEGIDIGPHPNTGGPESIA